MNAQTEITNKCVEAYLIVIHKNPMNWLDCILWMELWNNSNYHTALKMSPFKALYNCEVPSLPSYIPGSSMVVVVDMDHKGELIFSHTSSFQ